MYHLHQSMTRLQQLSSVTSFVPWFKSLFINSRYTFTMESSNRCFVASQPHGDVCSKHNITIAMDVGRYRCVSSRAFSPRLQSLATAAIFLGEPALHPSCTMQTLFVPIIYIDNRDPFQLWCATTMLCRIGCVSFGDPCFVAFLAGFENPCCR